MSTISGTCRTFGYGATRYVGDLWSTGLVGSTITIGGLPYTIESCPDSDHISITPAAPIADPVSWSMTVPTDPGGGGGGGGGGGAYTVFVPLTLACQCGLAGSGICTISSLSFTAYGYIGDFTLVILDVGGIDFINLNGSTTVSASVASFIGTTFNVSFFIGRSIGFTGFSTAAVNMIATAVYDCLLPDGSTSSMIQTGTFVASGIGECLSDDGTNVFFHASLGGGGGKGFMAHAGPLGCTTATAGPTPATLPFQAELVDDSTGTSPWCLCPLGGTFTYAADGTLIHGPTYQFAIIDGYLPSGQNLNQDTGCIEGLADPEHPGSDTVTFRVIDVESSEFADVECGLAPPPCPPKLVVNNAFL